jgi:hypothetical protein
MEIIEWIINIFKQVFGEYYTWILALMILLFVVMVYNKSMSLIFAGFVSLVLFITLSFLFPLPIIKYMTILIVLLLAVLVYRSIKNPYG